MVSDLWRLRESIDRGTIKGLYYGGFKADLVDALDRLMYWEEVTDEDLLLEGKSAEETLVALQAPWADINPSIPRMTRVIPRTLSNIT